LAADVVLTDLDKIAPRCRFLPSVIAMSVKWPALAPSAYVKILSKYTGIKFHHTANL